MTRYAMICAALLLAAPAAAQDPLQPSDSPATDVATDGVIDLRSDPQQFDLARKKVIDCEGEKFVFAWGAGARPTKVTLCSNKDATPEEVVQMLDEAATKLEQTESMPEDRRTVIVQQIRAKIAELKGTSATTAEPAAAVARVPVTTSNTAVQIAPNPVASLAATAAARPVLPARPRLSFACYTLGDLGSGGPCTLFDRRTRLTIEADEPLARGASLRFLRRGEMRAEVALQEMRAGQSVRVMLPPAMCAGVVSSEASIQVVRSGHVVDSIGPHQLRC